MRRTRLWLCSAAVSCFAALLPGHATGADAPTAQELLADLDIELQRDMAAWHARHFALPDDLVLDDALRQSARQLASEHATRMKALWPVWIAQERAEAGGISLQGQALWTALRNRIFNELALWSLDSDGPTYDDASIRAALAPRACEWLFPSHFARRIAMVQAAPPDARQVLLSGERTLLSRWGTKRQSVTPRPADADVDAAYRAIVQLRAGIPVAAEPMPPFLADRVFDMARKPGMPSRWEQCARSKWWLASQLASGTVARQSALAVYRYSMMFDVHESLPASVSEAAAKKDAETGPPVYPPTARYFGVEGSTSFEAELGELGKFIKARVVARKLKVPGVRDNPPVAFESLLDAATLSFASRHVYPADKGRSFTVLLNWRLDANDDEPR